MADTDIRGQLTDADGVAIENATVALIPNYASDNNRVVYTTTDANGEYVFDEHPQADGTSKEWHVAFRYDDNTGKYNFPSKPYVSAKLDISIPDSAIAHYTAAEGVLDSNGNPASDGDTVVTWEDQSGNGNHLQAKGGPIFEASGLNGNESVFFDGVDDAMNADNDPISRPNTVMVVGELVSDTSLSDWQWFVDSRDSSDNSDRHAVGWHQNGYWAARGGTSNDIDGSEDTAVQQFTGIFRDGSSVLREEGTVTASGDNGTNELGRIRLAADDPSFNNYSRVRISEVLVCETDLNTTDELLAQENRMTTTWSV